MTKTVVGLFETQEAAEVAVNALIALGYTNDQIGVALRGEIRAASASSNDPLLADVRTDERGMRKVLDQGATSGWNAEEYADRLNYSGVVVTVQTEATQIDHVEAVLQRYGSIDQAERTPSQTIDPSEAAVQEADAVDKPATDAVARQMTGLPEGSEGSSTSNNVPSSAGAVPLASAAEVAATKPTGLATLRPGDNDVGATTPTNQNRSTTAESPVGQEQAAALPQRPPRARSYTAEGRSYRRSDDGYPTPDLGENTEPRSGGRNNAVASRATGADPAPRERDLTLGEQFGGAMEDPAEEAMTDRPGDRALDGA